MTSVPTGKVVGTITEQDGEVVATGAGIDLIASLERRGGKRRDAPTVFADWSNGYLRSRESGVS